MPTRTKTANKDRFCPWCERKFDAAPEHRSPLCPECRGGLLEYDKEALVDLVGRMAGINVIMMASLSLHAPDVLETLGLWDSPEREGFSRNAVTMKEFAKKHMKVQ